MPLLSQMKFAFTDQSYLNTSIFPARALPMFVSHLELSHNQFRVNGPLNEQSLKMNLYHCLFFPDTSCLLHENICPRTHSPVTNFS